MNLVKKLPIGLGLACLMMMSSCSKEDAAVSPSSPQASEQMYSSHKGVTYVFPFFSPTIGATGKGSYPAGWGNLSEDDKLGFPAGTSSLTNLWGESALPWEKPLPAIPSAPNANSVVTTYNITESVLHDFQNHSVAGTTIKNLVAGKKYAITFYASTTKLKGPSQSVQDYASGIQVRLFAGANKILQTEINFTGKAEWVAKTINFVASGDEITFKFNPTSSSQFTETYAHLFVDHNSIKELKFNL
ncbi:hypothetical protein [Dyadobacter sp. CY326]|uniref:hypothetical protein n=1 Tax=Dyadobacter sp. CY326 TaxID=2907300 RepID=UPI001F44DE4F|nr:hypothetical protein [Dyadobacter sp. CY326]MCE7067346.1 hypothetical protein [Dyadobacter sp. CY326]